MWLVLRSNIIVGFLLQPIIYAFQNYSPIIKHSQKQTNRNTSILFVINGSIETTADTIGIDICIPMKMNSCHGDSAKKPFPNSVGESLRSNAANNWKTVELDIQNPKITIGDGVVTLLE